jgi:hypothetical protein
MKQKTLLLFVAMLITTMAFAQRDLGAFAHVSSETFYTKNISVSVGAKYKEFRLGLFYQSASRETGMFVRKGLIAEAGIISVDDIAFLSLGARVLTTSDDLIQVVPHTTIAFRLNKYVEIPIVLSTYSSWLTGSIGVRMLF